MPPAAPARARAVRGPTVLAATVLTAILLAVAGCGSAKVPLDAPAPEAADEAPCRALLDALPNAVNDELRRPVDPEDAWGAAYGDPPIVLLCGGRMPEEFDEFSPCVEVDGVGWYVPTDQLGDQPTEVTMTTIGFRPVVSVTVPQAYWRQGAVTTQVDLAPSIRKTLVRESRCR